VKQPLSPIREHEGIEDAWFRLISLGFRLRTWKFKPEVKAGSSHWKFTLEVHTGSSHWRFVPMELE
jgi:hypothetical protein